MVATEGGGLYNIDPDYKFRRGDYLKRTVAELKKQDPKGEDWNTFYTRFSLSKELAQYEYRTTEDVIKDFKKEIINRSWTPRSSEEMLFLNVEEQKEKDNNIDPDLADSIAYSTEAQRLEVLIKLGMPKDRKKPDCTKITIRTFNTAMLVESEKMQAMIDSLKFRYEISTSKYIEKVSKRKIPF